MVEERSRMGFELQYHRIPRLDSCSIAFLPLKYNSFYKPESTICMHTVGLLCKDPNALQVGCGFESNADCELRTRQKMQFPLPDACNSVTASPLLRVTVNGCRWWKGEANSIPVEYVECWISPLHLRSPACPHVVLSWCTVLVNALFLPLAARKLVYFAAFFERKKMFPSPHFAAACVCV